MTGVRGEEPGRRIQREQVRGHLRTIARNRARLTATILVSERLSSCRVDEREEEDFSAATPFAPRVAPAPS
ncbi:hypothetical protein C5E02_13485 [Rathayibacter rathayi]|nr:hypothetical protein C1O28_13795 [Rathayibacter rathayi]PPF49726.1 hypothetical protein C5C08_06655 [Rathayibacter rathayi]PPG65718.1 hypothetical protein C5C16_12640 [Rathayibacter rathayi]PPG76115.1 hypothetical protein C5C15_11615 [Rathayibacter rathayi]PPH69123.1 hypothetical protein C5C45_06600 [Rathayibacter rathayi]